MRELSEAAMASADPLGFGQHALVARDDLLGNLDQIEDAIEVLEAGPGENAHDRLVAADRPSPTAAAPRGQGAGAARLDHGPSRPERAPRLDDVRFLHAHRGAVRCADGRE